MNNEKEYLYTNSVKEKSEYRPTESAESTIEKSFHVQKMLNATAEGQKIERISKNLIGEIFVCYIELI
jgi:hypothetical protein